MNEDTIDNLNWARNVYRVAIFELEKAKERLEHASSQLSQMRSAYDKEIYVGRRNSKMVT